MARLSLLIVMMLTYGCALTAPEGTKELLEDINHDKANKRTQTENFVGKPIFYKIRAYPRIEGTTVYGKHWILLKIGYEKLELNPLLNDLN